MDNLQQPGLCIKGCGFHGNAVFANMCSKCFKESESALKKDQPAIAKDVPEVTKPIEKEVAVVTEEVAPKITEVATSAPEAAAPPQEEKPAERPKQADPSRCFVCRAKVPMLKQATNKCKCESTFCDKHKFAFATDPLDILHFAEKQAAPALPPGPDGTGHACDFDFQGRGKAILEKINPKLHEKKQGGRDFVRI